MTHKQNKTFKQEDVKQDHMLVEYVAGMSSRRGAVRAKTNLVTFQFWLNILALILPGPCRGLMIACELLHVHVENVSKMEFPNPPCHVGSQESGYSGHSGCRTP